MKIQFKNQKYQIDAVKAVTDVFIGQPFLQNQYLMDIGKSSEDNILKIATMDNSAWGNTKLVSEMNDDVILKNIKNIQINNGIRPISDRILRRDGEKGYNITIEMETGVGKTFTYIKTMFELNKFYGWTKFIIIVPSIAIREGVFKSFQMTSNFFLDEYGKKARYFIYNSKKLNDIDNFARDNTINVMIINSQAFNQDDANINKKLDSFRSRRPIDIIAKTNPIVIIDEPQSVEGPATIEKIKLFNPLFTIRYSATHKKDSIFNMVYRLDAVDAFQKKLVKKISVLGIEESGRNATQSYIYLKSINVSDKNPTATLEIDYKYKTTTKKKFITVKEGSNLYILSNELEEYKNNFIVNHIDARDDGLVSFINGKEMNVGSVSGIQVDEQIRRIQIRETIETHLIKEKNLYKKGIKVLTLFFIDKVENYKKYDGQSEVKGVYQSIFEEEYTNAIKKFFDEVDDECKNNNIPIEKHPDYRYIMYLKNIGKAQNTHTGYFSIDKKGHMTDSKIKKGETSANDENSIRAYELIMKDKERLLDLNPINSPWRFIFSHSALKEGWDNTNVFQICTLKEGNADVRRRQEIGRGLRLCVNNEGVRQDVETIHEDFFNVNELTVIASESYQNFVSNLQNEIREAVENRPIEVSRELFEGKMLHNANGEEIEISKNLANDIFFSLVSNHYVDSDGSLSSIYYEDKENNQLKFDDRCKNYEKEIVDILDEIYNPSLISISNARNNVELKIDKQKLNSNEFRELWKRINHKSVFRVSFESDELIDKSVKSINEHLNVPPLYLKLGKVTQKEDMDFSDLIKGEAFEVEETRTENKKLIHLYSSIKYDLIGKIASLTMLTRKDVALILKKIKPDKFNMFKQNPEEFILKISILINEAKSTTIVEHIEYNKLDETYGTDIFTDASIKGNLNKNCVDVKKHLYDKLVYDSKNELEFAKGIDTNKDVKLYIKLPGKFYINTPVGSYNPDFAIAYKEENKNHIYFVAETKGNMETLDLSLRRIEKIKTECAKLHFKSICGDDITYGVVDGLDGLLNILKK